MWALRISSRLMVAGPIALLTAIAINGHGGAPSDDRAIFGTETHKRILRYVEPIRSADVVASESESINSDHLDRSVKLWVDLANDPSGSYVMPVDFETPSQDTILGDIREAKVAVLFGLAQRARSEADAREFDKAAQSLVACIQIASVDKYSELATVHQFGQLQLRYAAALTSIVPKLSHEAKESSLKAIEQVRGNEGKLKSIVNHMREIHCASLARRNQIATTIELTEGYGAVAELVETRSSAAVAKLRQISVRANMPMEMASVGTVARLAVRSEEHYDAEMRKLTAALQSVK